MAIYHGHALKPQIHSKKYNAIPFNTRASSCLQHSHVYFASTALVSPNGVGLGDGGQGFHRHLDELEGLVVVVMAMVVVMQR